MKRARVLSIWLAVLLAAAVPYTVLAFGMEWRTTAGRMGPGFFPRIIGVALVITLSIGLYKSLRQRAEEADGVSHLRTLLVMIGATALFVVLFELVGALLASIMYMVTVLAVINPRRWLMNLVVGIALPVVLYLMFQTWLNAGLPPGVLGSAVS